MGLEGTEDLIGDLDQALGEASSRKSPAHARSKNSEAKQARRKKRRASQDVRWIPDTVLDGLSDDIELAAVLEKFDERITERGWVFDEELSDEESALWYFISSTAVGSPTTGKASCR